MLTDAEAESLREQVANIAQLHVENLAQIHGHLVASDQYGMHFILSQNNEILWRADGLSMDALLAMVHGANNKLPNILRRTYTRNARIEKLLDAAFGQLAHDCDPEDKGSIHQRKSLKTKFQKILQLEQWK